MVTKLKPLGIAELMALELPPQEWQIPGLFQVGQAVILSAREKSGKGLLAIDMAASIAEGLPFMGLEVTQGNAVYLAAEEDLVELKARVSARCGNNPDVPFSIVHLDGSRDGRLDLSREEDAQLIEDFIKEHEVNFLILDVLRQLHSSQEDSATEMYSVMRGLSSIAHRLHCTILVTHHESKCGGARGSTAITSGVDVQMRMVMDYDASSLSGKLTSNGRSVPLIEMDIRFDGEARWSGDVRTGSAPPQKATKKAQIITALVDAHQPMTAKELAEVIGIPNQTVVNEMSALASQHPDFVQKQRSENQGRAFYYELNIAALPPQYSHLFL